MVSHRPWLPAGAVHDTRLVDALSASLRSWASRWFSEQRSTSVRTSEMKSRTALGADTLCWGNAERGILLASHANAHTVIAGAMLSADCGAHRIKPNDQIILRRLASMAAQDLLKSTCGLFGVSQGFEETHIRDIEPKLRFTINIGQASQLLDLFIDEQTAIGARRSLLPRVNASTPPAGARRAAVDKQSIRLGAMLGTARLGVGELRALGVGDVLVLDRGPRDELALAVNGRRRERACQIVEDAGALKLRLGTLAAGG